MTTDKVIADIRAGRHDGQLLSIVESIRARLAAAGGATRWKITVDGFELTEESVTVREVRLAQEIAGCTWHDLDPRSNADHFAAVVVAHLVKVKGMPRAEAEARVDEMPMSEVTSALAEYEVPSGKE